jgi:hypothetical protein
MDVTPNEIGTGAGVGKSHGGSYALDPTDRPIPVWPEGVLALLAGVTLVLIGLKHRTWLQKKGQEAQKVVHEFQKQGGLDELTQVAQHAAELLKGGRG